MTGFVSVKLQPCSIQTATLLQTDLATYSFWNMYRKLAVLKRIFCEKTQWWTSVLIKLWPLIHSPQFYQKLELILDLSVEALKILMFLQGSSLVETFFSKVAGLEFISAI